MINAGNNRANVEECAQTSARNLVSHKKKMKIEIKKKIRSTQINGTIIA